jgi:hypothetical protein
MTTVPSKVNVEESAVNLRYVHHKLHLTSTKPRFTAIETI